jgi:Fe-S oxidoreductase
VVVDNGNLTDFAALKHVYQLYLHQHQLLIKAVCNNYVDMERSTIMESTFCCGGGGGLLTDDLMEIRIKGAMPRMQALKDNKMLIP